MVVCCITAAFGGLLWCFQAPSSSIKGSFFILLTRMQPLGVVHFWGCLPLKFELLHTLHTKWGPSIPLSSSSAAHQTWTVTYTWNHSLTASVPHIYSVKISFCLLRVAALTYKTCNSLKKVGHVIRKIRCNSSIKLQFCTCLWLFCVKSCKTMTIADPLSWSLLHRHTVLLVQ